ncbi:peptidase C39 family protein [Spongiibacter sp. KMU-158]|uniref:Peptidase C39 family protein n=1 Tax=Spongiibacter pelagi TaxID=2760804 RepID=A0A927GVT0_9GAMM|nr:peptidase C39 family protein [Spongiibacter pelagi]MBD2858725.1 peptidase C39 family protein [Spongiibacter pelagi]
MPKAQPKSLSTPADTESQQALLAKTGAAELRLATLNDLPSLLHIEQSCFNSDRLSKRSFRGLIKPGAHKLLVLETGGAVAGYSLLLFRRGTSLARLYSIAIHPDYRGKGFAKTLLLASETAAKEQGSVFLRLEVNECNQAAIALYEQLAYRKFDRVEDYYEDGGTALRYEKRLSQRAEIRATLAPDYYAQTTEFTCGPASLMMAIHDLNPAYAMTRSEELGIWREATTIFMTSGHGGCSPHGLALAALQRGFRSTLYINTADTPFRDSVRDPQKREVIDLVHQDFLQEMQQQGLPIEINPLGPAQFKSLLESHEHIIALISTWALDRNRAPHWVYIRRSDAQFVYINDPDNRDAPWPSDSDYRHVPIPLDAFISMASFGRSRLRCLLVIHPGDKQTQ